MRVRFGERPNEREGADSIEGKPTSLHQEEPLPQERRVALPGGEEVAGQGYNSHPRELMVVDKLGSVPVDQGTEGQTVLPAEK